MLFFLSYFIPVILSPKLLFKNFNLLNKCLMHVGVPFMQDEINKNFANIKNYCAAIPLAFILSRKYFDSIIQFNEARGWKCFLWQVVLLRHDCDLTSTLLPCLSNGSTFANRGARNKMMLYFLPMTIFEPVYIRFKKYVCPVFLSLLSSSSLSSFFLCTCYYVYYFDTLLSCIVY